MPGIYAHHRFAAAQLECMDKETKNVVSRFRQLYDVGAQGPDPLFYYGVFGKSKQHALGHQIHMEPGKLFFERAGRIYRAQPTEGAYAYLLGCLTHFCLDSNCHPFVNGVDAAGEGKHIALETEFNRFLMEMDGVPTPYIKNQSCYVSLSAGGCETAAAFYEGMSRRAFARCMGGMRLFNGLFAAPEGWLRNTVASVAGSIGHGGFMMTKDPDAKHCVFNQPMLERYEQAMRRFPGMLEQLLAHLQTGTPLGEEFDAIYG